MKKCCVCNKKASALVKGLWWCEKHVDYTKGEIRQVVRVSEAESPVEKDVKLDLAWV